MHTADVFVCSLHRYIDAAEAAFGPHRREAPEEAADGREAHPGGAEQASDPLGESASTRCPFADYPVQGADPEWNGCPPPCGVRDPDAYAIWSTVAFDLIWPLRMHQIAADREERKRKRAEMRHYEEVEACYAILRDIEARARRV